MSLPELDARGGVRPWSVAAVGVGDGGTVHLFETNDDRASQRVKEEPALVGGDVGQ
jgi:hypothetical protein